MKPFKETIRRIIEAEAEESERSFPEASREIEHAQFGFYWIVASIIVIPSLLAENSAHCIQEPLGAVLFALVAGFFLALPLGVLAQIIPWPFAWVHRHARRLFPLLP